jgi:hypothetical protein
MAKRAPSAENNAGIQAANDKPEEKFVELMLAAADFVKSCGSLEQAKKALMDAGHLIQRSGSVAQAERALEVLESLKEKIA